MQKLITAEIKNKAKKFPLYSQDGKKGEAVVLARFFMPYTRQFTWYMLEYDTESGDAFGWVVGDEPEYGYFNVNELQSLKTSVRAFGITAELQAVERDICIDAGKITLAEALKKNSDPEPSFWKEEK